MYTDEVQLSADNVLGIMYTAKKYIITNLSKKCSGFLQENLSADTAPQLLEQSIIFNEKDLKAKVLTKIREEASTVLPSEEFTTLSKEALHEVLQLSLKISSEMEVLNASLKWAETRCKQLKRTMNGANMREVLGDSLFLIRFPTMTLDDINDTVILQNILTDREQLHVLRYLTAKSKPENLPFPIEPRFDPTPRALLISTDCDELLNSIIPSGSYVHSTNLDCTLSRPAQIRKIFIHAFSESHLFKHNLIVTLTQNVKTLLNYVGRAPIILESQGTPRHFAVEAKDVYVEAGALQVDIQLTLTNANRHHEYFYSHITSPQKVTKLSDNFVSIEFTPVAENLLLGFEYSLM